MSEDDYKFAAPLMEAIGNVAHHWAGLEHEINKAIWELMGISPEDGACVTAQIMSVVPRMRALIALVERKGGTQKLIRDLNKFSTEADRLARRRNRVIHDPWFFRPKPIDEHTAEIEYGRLEITADRKLSFEVKLQTRKDVLDVAHDTIAALKKFRELRERIGSELKKSQEEMPSEGQPSLGSGLQS